MCAWRQCIFMKQREQDITEIAECRVRDGVKRKEKTTDGNIPLLAEVKLLRMSL